MKRWFREPMNGLTHFIGILFGGVVLFLLLSRKTELVLTLQHTISFSIFGVAMILLYTTSTLYHWLKVSEETTLLLRKMDHTMIFVFIAASYTPICLVVLKGTLGWGILIGIWSIALLGFFMKLFWLGAPRTLYTSIYVLMGWMIVFAIFPLSKVFATQGIFLLALGGVFYSVGAVIYGLKKPNPWPDFFGFHEIFHLFILAGSFSHFCMMYWYV